MRVKFMKSVVTFQEKDLESILIDPSGGGTFYGSGDSYRRRISSVRE